jgi:hypothetical protein
LVLIGVAAAVAGVVPGLWGLAVGWPLAVVGFGCLARMLVCHRRARRGGGA